MMNDVAIIGIGLRIADCTSMMDYYLKLQKKEGLYQTLEGNRLKDIKSYLKKIHKSAKDYSGQRPCFLKDIDQFNYSAFQLSPKEAAYMDPNQRLMLETVYSAFLDSGINMNHGSNTSVFIGYKENKDYLKLIETYDPDMLSFALPGNLSAAVAGRISYTFDWKGTSMLMDSGDSSALLALQSACNSILYKEADIAVAGGIDLCILPFEDKDGKEGYEFTQKGECVAAIVLKALPAALKDKDSIFGIIKACTSNRGPAPDALYQKEKLLNVCLQTVEDMDNRLGMVELSGTADKMEKQLIERIWSKSTLTTKGEPAIDVLSDNINNLDVTSGLMGLIKVLLSTDNQPDIFHTLDRKKNAALLAHFGKDGGNTCAILEKSEHIDEIIQLAQKRDTILQSGRCWINY